MVNDKELMILGLGKKLCAASGPILFVFAALLSLFLAIIACTGVERTIEILEIRCSGSFSGGIFYDIDPSSNGANPVMTWTSSSLMFNCGISR